MSQTPRRLLIAGCGDLGNRLAARLDDWQVHGLRRNTARLAPGIVPLQADLSRPAMLDAAAGYWDAVVYTATPADRTPEAYRQAYVTAMRELIRRIDTPRWIMVSSTAVFGQDQGQWVDESSPTEPARFNGEILLEAERLAGEAGGVVLRFSGIYGPGRDYLVRKVRGGPVGCRRNPPIWTNRIHSEDCAAALAHLLDLEDPEPLYLASDACPAARWEVLEWLAERLGAPGPFEQDDDDTGQGKRIRAERLIATGFALQYPDYRSGYEEVLQCV
ncbi:MAG: SDR family NAD(P)-dependent oxidoreductase [Wenzhouxiangellaceae bacterium]